MRLLGAASRIGLCPVNVKPPAWPGDTYFEDEDYLAVTFFVRFCSFFCVLVFGILGAKFAWEVLPCSVGDRRLASPRNRGR